MNKTLVAFTLILATTFAALSDINLATATLPNSGVISIVGATAGDKIGYSVTNIGKFNNDDYLDYAISCGDEAAVYIILGLSTARATSLDLSTPGTTNIIQITLPSDHATTANPAVVGYAGDVNNDGKDDVVIGCPAAPGAGSTTVAGAAYVIYGKSTAITSPIDVSTTVAAGVGFKIADSATANNAKLGAAVATAGNFDGDVYDDIIIGAPGEKKAYIIRGKASTGTDSTSIRSGVALDIENINTAPAGAAQLWEGYSISDTAGSSTIVPGDSVAYGGDINGDGRDDVIVSALTDHKVFVIYGVSTTLAYANLDLNPATTADLTKYWMITGPASIDFGKNVAGGSNFNSKSTNLNDVVIGAPAYSTNTGRVFVIYGSKPASGTDIADLDFSSTSLDATKGITFTGAAQGDVFGTNSDFLGDVNGDGIADLGIGAPGNVNTKIGKVYVIYGSTSVASRDLSSSALTSAVGVTISGATAGDYFGSAISSVGDVSTDGVADFVVSAPSAAASASKLTTGAVYEFRGQKTSSTGSGSRLAASFLVLVSFFVALMF